MRLLRIEYAGACVRAYLGRLQDSHARRTLPALGQEDHLHRLRPDCARRPARTLQHGTMQAKETYYRGKSDLRELYNMVLGFR